MTSEWEASLDWKIQELERACELDPSNYQLLAELVRRSESIGWKHEDWSPSEWVDDFIIQSPARYSWDGSEFYRFPNMRRYTAVGKRAIPKLIEQFTLNASVEVQWNILTFLSFLGPAPLAVLDRLLDSVCYMDGIVRKQFQWLCHTIGDQVIDPLLEELKSDEDRRVVLAMDCFGFMGYRAQRVWKDLEALKDRPWVEHYLPRLKYWICPSPKKQPRTILEFLCPWDDIADSISQTEFVRLLWFSEVWNDWDQWEKSGGAWDDLGSGYNPEFERLWYPDMIVYYGLELTISSEAETLREEGRKLLESEDHRDLIRSPGTKHPYEAFWTVKADNGKYFTCSELAYKAFCLTTTHFELNDLYSCVLRFRPDNLSKDKLVCELEWSF